MVPRSRTGSHPNQGSHRVVRPRSTSRALASRRRVMAHKTRSDRQYLPRQGPPFRCFANLRYR